MFSEKSRIIRLGLPPSLCRRFQIMNLEAVDPNLFPPVIPFVLFRVENVELLSY